MERFYIYIVLTRTNTIISRLIQFFKRDEFTHAAISMDRDLANMYSFGRKYVFYPFIGVFKHENLNKGTYKYCKVLPGAVIELEVTKQQYKRAKTLLEYFISNAGQYKYNYVGLINSLINREACHNSRFVCSEFVYYILNESGIADFKISRNLVRPQSLLKLDGRIIYKGDLKNSKLLNRCLRGREIHVNQKLSAAL
ncbi:hypothetical protein [Acetivibrio straminisolvens]|jgi:hypothetical protein|uniref:Uncharacterized protein n=1 Tax=Acetivibrio straminisolvens JCM 21531 TaxID=1294263 RepID=W4V1S5_9FIRM|nr:hypothetical protein [Acetivibrio straminisolvens]GAE87176.1 hypothetical protein JCM21531_525 [Acetivibrio straminisolvens JCM 21531]